MNLIALNHWCLNQNVKTYLKKINNIKLSFLVNKLEQKFYDYPKKSFLAVVFTLYKYPGLRAFYEGLVECYIKDGRLEVYSKGKKIQEKDHSIISSKTLFDAILDKKKAKEPTPTILTIS